MHHRFVRCDTVHDALVNIRATQIPRSRAKQHVRRVVAFRQVVERTTLFRVRQRIRSTVVRDGQVAFFNVDIRSTVFTHGAEFDQVAIRRKLFDRVQDVNGTHDVVRLRENRTRSIHHRVRRRTLLTKVHRGSRVEFLKRRAQKLVVAHVADEQLDLSPGNFFPLANSFVDGFNRRQGVETELIIERTSAQVIDDGDLVASLGQVQRRRPSAVTITADNHNALTFARVRGVRSRVDRLNDQRRLLLVAERGGGRHSQRVAVRAHFSRAQDRRRLISKRRRLGRSGVVSLRGGSDDARRSERNR